MLSLQAIQNEKVDPPLCEHYRKMKNDMLQLAEKCFNGALEAATNKEGEQWLHYYMLGKTAEKLKKSADVFLDYYQKVLIQTPFILNPHCSILRGVSFTLFFCKWNLECMWTFYNII